MSDFHDQWLIWKLIAKTTRLSNNITVLCKENIEEMAVEKDIFPADIHLKFEQNAVMRLFLLWTHLKMIWSRRKSRNRSRK